MVAKGLTMKSEEDKEDMYAAIDLMVDKIERQLKRYKEKLKSHKGSAPVAQKEAVEVAQGGTAPAEETDGTPEIIRDHSRFIKPMSVEEAVMQMDLLDKEFLVFTEDNSEQMNVVYRRKDGNYGLIVPPEK